LFLHWKKVFERGVQWIDFCKKILDLPSGQLWRHNQAGDFYHDNGIIDQSCVKALVDANKGKLGYTYTHHDMGIEENREIVSHCNQNGFTVNLSADNLKEADEFVSLEIAPVCVILPWDTNKNLATPGGNRIVICPATTKDNVTCEKCRLCARSNRKVIVGFPSHGAQKKKATQISIS
jgi:hypothetical protein